MGCICAKEDSSKKELDLGSLAGSNSINPIVSLSAFKDRIETHPYIKNIESGSALITFPTSSFLYKRIWVNKQGHLVRNWKKRYCVITRTELQYFQKALDIPPYGSANRGSISFLGAVCSKNENKYEILVEMYGNSGEKDIYLSLPNNEQAKVNNNRICLS